MSDKDQTIAIKLYTDAARFVSGLNSAGSNVKKFTSGVKREFESLKGTLGSVKGQLASIGVTVGAVATIMQSAKMDKSLTQIGQTAGMTREEVAGLRKELFRMAGETGQNRDDLQAGFNNLIQSGLVYKEALPTIDAINKAVAVTGANAEKLAGGLTVAGTAFNFDLAKPKQASLLLDQMTVAGRQGNAELENLSDIFARVGVNASSAGMGFTQTLAFIEGLSLIERQPERLATLADSTLRLFTNATYMKNAQKATGIKFFNKDGSRRDTMEALADFKKQYDKLKTDRERAGFINKAFGKADLDTIKGLKTLFGGDLLRKIGEFKKEQDKAGGKIEKDLFDAINNAVDQTGRLKAAMGLAADEFSKPINETLTNVIKWGLDKKSNGGLELSGNEMLGYGAAGGLGILATARYGSKGLKSLAGKFGGMGAGIATGKALETAAGVTPVYVVNMPSSMGGTVADIATGAGASSAAKAGRLAPLLATGLPLAVGAVVAYSAYNAYEAYGNLSESQKKGREESEARRARRAAVDKKLFAYGGSALVASAKNYDFQQLSQITNGIDHANQTKVGGQINIKIDSEGRPSVTSLKSNNPGVNFNVDAGMVMTH